MLASMGATEDAVSRRLAAEGDMVGIAGWGTYLEETYNRPAPPRTSRAPSR
jgi:hypothetical protein